MKDFLGNSGFFYREFLGIGGFYMEFLGIWVFFNGIFLEFGGFYMEFWGIWAGQGWEIHGPPHGNKCGKSNLEILRDFFFFFEGGILA